MNNKYINALTPHIKNTLMEFQLQGVSEIDKKSIKFEYIIKTVIANVLILALICTVTVFLSFREIANTNLILLSGATLFIITLILSILLTSYIVSETCKNSYIFQAYIAKTQLWNGGHTKVYIVYYDKKQEKFTLTETFLSIKNNLKRYVIMHDFVNIVVKEKKNKIVYLMIK